ncbi:hypothetical protein M0R01_03870 [bacterium]|nr:hypothetical protein [bacterium]
MKVIIKDKTKHLYDRATATKRPEWMGNNNITYTSKQPHHPLQGILNRGK